MQTRPVSLESVERKESSLNHTDAPLLERSDGLPGPTHHDQFWCTTGWVIVAIAFILTTIIALSMDLTSGFLHYFTDNILVMMMADSASLVGTNFFWQLAKSAPIMQQWLGLLFNMVVTLILWFIAKSYHGTSHSTDTATHVLDMIPWIIKVGMLNLLGAYNNGITSGLKEATEMGEEFTYDFLFFVALFPLGWFINSLAAKFALDLEDKYSLGSFLWYTINGGFTSCTGKAMHYCVHVIIFSLHDHNQPEKSLKAYGGMELIVLMISSFLLIYILPRMSAEKKDEEDFRDHLAFLIIYCWAFSFVDFTWWLFYMYLGASSMKGQVYFWLFIMFLVNLALFLARGCQGNFYGGSSEISKGVANMLCWAIEFGAWWAWAQAMSDFDTSISIYPGCSVTRMFNFGVTLGLIVGIVVVQKFVDLEEMLEHRAAKAKPIVSKAKNVVEK
jgi:hypothetical protein